MLTASSSLFLKTPEHSSEVDRADSPSVSPGSDEHEEGVEADKTEEGAHESGEESHLGASGLAVDVTVINHGDVVIEEVLVEVLVVVAHGSNTSRS